MPLDYYIATTREREPTATHSPSVVASRDIQSHLTHYAAYYALRSSRQIREKPDAVAVQKSREKEKERGGLCGPPKKV